MSRLRGARENRNSHPGVRLGYAQVGWGGRLQANSHRGGLVEQRAAEMEPARSSNPAAEKESPSLSPGRPG